MHPGLPLARSRGRQVANVAEERSSAPLRWLAPGDVAQLARAPALQAGGRGFESHRLHSENRSSEGCVFVRVSQCLADVATLNVAFWPLATSTSAGHGDGEGASPRFAGTRPKQRWMAWVRFPDGSRRKVERVDKADAQRDLDELLTLRSAGASSPAPRHETPGDVRRGDRGVVRRGLPERRSPTEQVAPRPGEVAEHDRQRPPTARHVSVLPGDRQAAGRPDHDASGSRSCSSRWSTRATRRARSTATGTTSTRPASTRCGARRIKTNPAADVLLPAIRPSKPRKSFTIDQAQALLTDGDPGRPAARRCG